MDEDELTDIEIKILKQLHDRVNRPARNMASRLNHPIDEVQSALQDLRKRGYVEPRSGGAKWRITFDGEEVLKEQAIDRQRFADKGDVQEIASAQIQLLTQYYNEALTQAQKSFDWALRISIAGFVLFLIAAILFFLGAGIEAAAITSLSGALIQVIAGINFYLYGKTSNQLSLFHTRLDITQRILLADSLCENLEGEIKQNTRSDLIKQIILNISDELKPETVNV